MVTVTQSTAPRTITTKSGMLLPTTIDQSTDFNLITTATSIFYKMSGCLGSYATVVTVADAMRDSSAVVVLYVGLDGGQDARVLWPNSITFTKENKIVARCYCTLRREWKTFRIDRMLTCHELTTPDDAREAA
ncbi:MAG: WYL domain-containing protein [Thermomicrobiales bacterium]